MRALIGSLLLVALSAILGVGWILDLFFDRLANETISDEVKIYQHMGARLAAILDSPANPASALAEEDSTQFLTMSLQAARNFQLPAPMLEEFESGEALVLESEKGVSLHYYLPAREEVLTITPNHYNAGTRSVIHLMFTTAFYIVVLILLLLWLYPLIRRLNRLSAAAKDFGKGQLDRRVSTRGVSYISDIELEFNRMAERIQTLISDNQLLSSAVSHDLRTPLARLRFGIDTLEDTGNPQSRGKYIRRLSADISEMETLVSSLLDFARLDHAVKEGLRDILPVESLIKQCVGQYGDANITTKLVIQGHHLLRGSESHLTMLVGNLLQNAHKYAVQSVLVDLRNTAAGSLLSVSDDGPGIPASQHRSVSVAVYAW